MTTVLEIESAIEKLPGKALQELTQWMEEYRASINATAEVFSMYDEEEDGGSQWVDLA